MLMLYSGTRLLSKQLTRLLLSSSVKQGQRFIHSPSPKSVPGHYMRMERRINKSKEDVLSLKKNAIAVFFHHFKFDDLEIKLKEAEEDIIQTKQLQTSYLFPFAYTANKQMCEEASKLKDSQDGKQEFKVKYEEDKPIEDTNVFAFTNKVNYEEDSILSSHTLAYWTLAAEKAFEAFPDSRVQRQIEDTKTSFEKLHGYPLEEAFDHTNFEMVLKPAPELE